MRSHARPPLLRQMNERKVLEALQHCGPLSRAEIMRHTGVSGPTVTRAVASLLEANLLEEGEFRSAAMGRPGKVLRLASSLVVLGVVVGVRQCQVVSAGLDGVIHQENPHSFATPPRYGDLVEAILRQVKRTADGEGKPLLGVGLSIPGLLDRREKRTVVSPNLHQADGRQLGEDLRRHLGIETALLQESHALCLAERTYGEARGIDDFAMLDISDGLGLGVVNGGRIMEGHSGLAGELGHITVVLDGQPCGCGNRGCLETVATDTALAAALSQRLGRKLTIEDVVAQVQEGSLTAEREIDGVLAYLSVGTAAVINIFNPSKLFVHGRLLDLAPDLFDRLLKLTQARALAPSWADCAMIRASGNKCLGAVAGIIRQLTTGRDEPSS